MKNRDATLHPLELSLITVDQDSVRQLRSPRVTLLRPIPIEPRANSDHPDFRKVAAHGLIVPRAYGQPGERARRSWQTKKTLTKARVI